MCLLTVWESQMGKCLTWGHGIRTKLSAITKSQIQYFPIQPNLVTQLWFLCIKVSVANWAWWILNGSWIIHARLNRWHAWDRTAFSRLALHMPTCKYVFYRIASLSGIVLGMINVHFVYMYVVCQITDWFFLYFTCRKTQNCWEKILHRHKQYSSSQSQYGNIKSS